MRPWSLAVWLPFHLLLLQLPGCCLLEGPRRVTGTKGESLSLQCWYEEKYKTYNKYWCKHSLVLGLRCKDTVKTKNSETEVSRGRVSISDHPENLTFTVTLKNLTMKDAGSYWCGIRTPWSEGFDVYFQVEVSVLPCEPPSCQHRGRRRDSATAKSSTTTIRATAEPSTSPAEYGHTQGSSSQEDGPKGQGTGLLTLLSLLTFLLLLLVGASLLAWRILQRRVKGGEPPELSQNLRQGAGQSEPQYANLQLHTWALQEGPAPPRQEEVEYSTVVFSRKEEELHYSSMVFNSQKQDSNTRRPQEETEYSLIQEPEKTPSAHPPPS